MTDSIGDFLGLTTGTPLQRTLAKLAVLLFLVALLFAFIVFAANGFRTEREIVLYAVGTGLSMSEFFFGSFATQRVGIGCTHSLELLCSSRFSRGMFYAKLYFVSHGR